MGQCLLKVTQQINDKIKFVYVSQLSSYCFATSPTTSSFDICSSIIVLLPGKPDAWDFFGFLRLCKMRSRMFPKSYTPLRDLTQEAIISLLFPWEKQDFCKLYEPK